MQPEYSTPLKKCSSCGVEKPRTPEHFRRWRRNPDGFDTSCKACKNAYCRARYAQNRARILAKQAEYRARNRDKIRARGAEWRKRPENREKLKAYQHDYYHEHQEFLRSLKSAGCSACGYNEHPDCLDFHHVNPEEKEWKQNLLATRRKPQMLAEIAKCVLLCANCHRLLHATGSET